MPDTQLRATIERLLARIDDLEDEVSDWQGSDPPTSDRVRDIHRAYQEWYAEACQVVLEGDRDRFRDMYEGGIVISRIRAFLGDPLGPSLLYVEGQPNPLLSRWQHPFETTFRDCVTVQRQLLVSALHAVSGASAVVDELVTILRRLPEFLGVLSRSGNSAVPAPTIRTEADLQIVVHAILRLLYDDVRPEDPVPQHAGRSTRVDFLLRTAGVIVETKMTRAGLGDRALGDELLLDWGRYTRHPDCRAIVGLVYDPEQRVANTAAIEHDLSQNERTPVTRVVVVR